LPIWVSRLSDVPRKGIPMNRSDNDVVLLSAVRTPIGKFQGSLSTVPAPQLGAVAVREAVVRAGIAPGDVQEVILGNVVQAGEGQAPARQAMLAAGLPETTGALTVNKVCGSGLKAVMLAASAIRAGEGDVFVAGGMESMNQAPFLLTRARFGYRLGHGEVLDALVHDGLWCAIENQHMGLAAEWIADEFGVSRKAQDEFALESHRRAIAALDAGRFGLETVPVPVHRTRGADLQFEADENPRRDSNLASLAALPPAFRENGSVTAGNAPGVTDGAAALVVAARAAAQRSTAHPPLARVLATAQAGLRPLQLFVAPTLALSQLAEKVGMRPTDFDLVEINEAFAAQTVANIRSLGLDPGKVNVNGGSIALGHPIGASGARILVTLIHALRARGGGRGAAVLCLGGGEAVALAIETE
jgi:acetyl-CoA C-acetyltransferase